MDPKKQFCPNENCADCGKVGGDNITIHSQKEKRYYCKTCGKTFAATHGTPFYRRHYDPQIFAWVVSLLGHGCPKVAIVATFCIDPRTVDDWWKSSGEHSKGFHQAEVQQGQMDLKQVQLDEIRHKVQGAIIWIAMAICVTSRLWLGAVVSTHRDTSLVVNLVGIVKEAALCRPLLICFDGFKAYISACRGVFSTLLETGLVPWPNICLGQIIKQYAHRRVVNVTRNLIQGSQTMAMQLLTLSQGCGVLNTSFIERLNATFRSRLALLARRTRHLLKHVEKVEPTVYLVGCLYNFCSYHKSLRQLLYVVHDNHTRRHWIQQTPAMAAGITDHRWTVFELLSYRLLPPSRSCPNSVYQEAVA